jgi:hypothetical protein
MIGAHEALDEVIISRLRNASPLWGVRVQPIEYVSSTLARPYVCFFQSSGGRDLVNPHRKNAAFTKSIKGVADDKATALAMQQAISELMDDSGRQDINSGLPVHAQWDITTVTEDREIWLDELFSGATHIYHAGHQYMFTMERKA